MYIKYTILEKIQYAGPYNIDEIIYHYKDISTFEGVSNVLIVSDKPVIPIDFDIYLDNVGTEENPHYCWKLAHNYFGPNDICNSKMTQEFRRELSKAYQAFAYAIETNELPEKHN